MQKVIALL